MRSKLATWLLISGLLSTPSLAAHSYAFPGDWILKADFLYFMPTLDDTYFVYEGFVTDASIGAFKNNNFNFNPGFRVGAEYAFCNCNRDFLAHYTRFRTVQERTIAGSRLIPTVGTTTLSSSLSRYAGTASSRLDVLYQTVDGVFSQKAGCFCNLDLYFQGGIEYAYFRLQENFVFASVPPAVGFVKDKSHYWGIGPKIGLECDYTICDFYCYCPGKLSVIAATSGSLMTGQQKMKETIILLGKPDSTLMNATSDDTWRMIPAFHFNVGLNYAMCFTYFATTLEIGYEFNSYVRGLGREFSVFSSIQGHVASFTDFSNFDIQGLYISADFMF